jgi:hypothetical protein
MPDAQLRITVKAGHLRFRSPCACDTRRFDFVDDAPRSRDHFSSSWPKAAA